MPGRFVRELWAVDAHAAGEPGRVLVGGVPEVPGKTMYAKMRHLGQEFDWLRLLMLREPRGYPAANCNVLLPPTDERADAGFVIMEQTEYVPMSGSNTICVATVLVEMGLVEVTEPVTEMVLETPAGLIAVRAEVSGGRATSITFENVPSFVSRLDAEVEVPGLGTVRVDVAYGGMFYVIMQAAPLGLRLTPDEGRDITRLGEMVKAAAREQVPAVHPQNPGIAGPTIALFSGPASRPDADLKNAVVVSTGELGPRPRTLAGALDRSPCGTGTSAVMATLHARGRLPLDVEFRHEGILGTVFSGRLRREVRLAGRAAVVPTITGSAWVTGTARYVLDPDDPFPAGYTVGDIWAP
ncbi:MAG: proline racemase family protein [Candidatus Dormibacterales bacterium]